MKFLERASLALVAVMLTAQVALAGGLASHASGNSRVLLSVRSADFSRLDRPPSRNTGIPSYRRPQVTRPRVGSRPGNSVTQRALAEMYGYEMRDGLDIGLGRMNASRYTSQRDQRIANSQGRRVGFYGTRIGSTLHRMFQP